MSPSPQHLNIRRIGCGRRRYDHRVWAGEKRCGSIQRGVEGARIPAGTAYTAMTSGAAWGPLLGRRCTPNQRFKATRSSECGRRRWGLKDSAAALAANLAPAFGRTSPRCSAAFVPGECGDLKNVDHSRCASRNVDPAIILAAGGVGSVRTAGPGDIILHHRGHGEYPGI